MIIQKNFEDLVSNLDSRSLLSVLFEKKVISLAEMEDMMQDRTLTMHNANIKLLNTMAEKSIDSFRVFLDGLKQTKQLDIYSALVVAGT